MKKFLSIFSFLLIILISACHNDNEKEIRSLIVANDAVMKSDKEMENAVSSCLQIIRNCSSYASTKLDEISMKGEESFSEYEQLVTYISDLKYELISLVTGISKEQIKIAEEYSIKEDSSFLSKFTGLDNYKIPTMYLFDTKGSRSKLSKATELKYEIIAFKEKIYRLIDPKNYHRVDIGLDVEKLIPDKDGERNVTWEMYNFYNSNLASDVILLNSLILDVRSAEKTFLGYLLSLFDGPDLSFSSVEVVVSDTKKHTMAGDIYEAEIFLAAYDSLASPKIIIGAGVDTATMTVLGNPTVLENKNGKCLYRIKTDKPGEYKFGGVAEFTNRYGAKIRFPFNSSYFVEAKQK